MGPAYIYKSTSEAMRVQMNANLYSRSIRSVYLSVMILLFPTLLQDLITQGALKGRGIDKMLEEAREDNKENDVLNMRRKCKNSDAKI